LRTKPLRDFTVEDLRIMIGQQVALNRLVPLALKRLRPDPLMAGDSYPGDLLASVLRVDAAFWDWSPDLTVEMRKLGEDLRERFTQEPELRERIKRFIQGHPTRPVRDATSVHPRDRCSRQPVPRASGSALGSGISITSGSGWSGA
jgi:hypothetical protein